MDVISRPNAPSQRRQVTRARLRERAVVLFAERGLSGVTSHDIAEAAGVAAGTFYLHFRDKQSLFREIVQDAIARLQARLAEVGAGAADAAPEAGARARAEALLTFAEHERDLVLILFGRDAGSGSLAAEVVDQLAAWVEADLTAPAHRAPAAGVHPAVAAQAIVGMWARVCTWWAEQPDRAPRADVIETLVAVQLTGTVGLGHGTDAC